VPEWAYRFESGRFYDTGKPEWRAVRHEIFHPHRDAPQIRPCVLALRDRPVLLSYLRSARGQGMTEQELLAAVIHLADDIGLYWWRDQHSLTNKPGFPDLLLIGQSVLWVELKSQYGQLSSQQVAFKYRLIAAGASYACWRPSDYESGEIERELRLIA
jgi:hypothetical protein